MVLNEERHVQNSRSWLARFARERRNLSASVEETLVEATPRERSWNDDVFSITSSMQIAAEQTFFSSAHNRSVQSQTVSTSTVHTRRIDTIPPSQQMEKQKRKKKGTTQHPFKRFAQRISASISSLGTPPRSDYLGSATVSSMGEPLKPHDKLVPPSLWPVVTNTDIATSLHSDKDAFANDLLKPDSRLPFPVIQSSHMGIMKSQMGTIGTLSENLGQSKQRLAGHPSKVHLEVAARTNQPVKMDLAAHTSIPGSYPAEALAQTSFPLPDISPSGHIMMQSAIPRSNPWSSQWTYQEVEQLAFPDPAPSFLPPVRISSLGSNYHSTLPVSFMNFETPLISPPQQHDDNSCEAFFGVGVIEFGQRDVVVRDDHVTETSVVLVTLTSNPGPVVVQYISIQPLECFTVHLTAPTMMRTTFNYTIIARSR